MEHEREVEAYAERIIDLALDLESQARRLIVDHLPEGSKERLLLRADRNVQRRHVKAVLAERADNKEDEEAEIEKEQERTKDEDRLEELIAVNESTFDQIRKYRQTFARLLAAGSRLQGLEGEKRYLFERRRARQQQQKKEEAESATNSKSQ
jgi:potassium channel subfamily K